VAFGEQPGELEGMFPLSSAASSTNKWGLSRVPWLDLHPQRISFFDYSTIRIPGIWPSVRRTPDSLHSTVDSPWRWLRQIRREGGV